MKIIISVYRLTIVARNTVRDRKTAGVEKIIIELKTYFSIDSWRKLVHILWVFAVFSKLAGFGKSLLFLRFPARRSDSGNRDFLFFMHNCPKT